MSQVTIRDGSQANMEQLHDGLGLGERRISVVREEEKGFGVVEGQDNGVVEGQDKGLRQESGEVEVESAIGCVGGDDEKLQGQVEEEEEEDRGGERGEEKKKEEEEEEEEEEQEEEEEAITATVVEAEGDGAVTGEVMVGDESTGSN
jgi:hypothetical protein